MKNFYIDLNRDFKDLNIDQRFEVLLGMQSGVNITLYEAKEFD